MGLFIRKKMYLEEEKTVGGKRPQEPWLRQDGHSY
jgi:hypothetical protein